MFHTCPSSRDYALHVSNIPNLISYDVTQNNQLSLFNHILLKCSSFLACSAHDIFKMFQQNTVAWNLHVSVKKMLCIHYHISESIIHRTKIIFVNWETEAAERRNWRRAVIEKLTSFENTRGQIKETNRAQRKTRDLHPLNPPTLPGGGYGCLFSSDRRRITYRKKWWWARQFSVTNSAADNYIAV